MGTSTISSITDVFIEAVLMRNTGEILAVDIFVAHHKVVFQNGIDRISSKRDRSQGTCCRTGIAVYLPQHVHPEYWFAAALGL